MSLKKEWLVVLAILNIRNRCIKYIKNKKKYNYYYHNIRIKDKIILEGKELRIPKQADLNDAIISGIQTLVVLLILYGMYYYYKRLKIKKGR